MTTLIGALPAAERETFIHMLDRTADVSTIAQQIRLCRLKLGSALNRLESSELHEREIELIREHVDDISNEIRLLIASLPRMMDR
jgi:hypothetical protein